MIIRNNGQIDKQNSGMPSMFNSPFEYLQFQKNKQNLENALIKKDEEQNIEPTSPDLEATNLHQLDNETKMNNINDQFHSN